MTKLGGEIVEKEKIVIHDSQDADSNVQIGILPSGAAVGYQPLGSGD